MLSEVGLKCFQGAQDTIDQDQLNNQAYLIRLGHTKALLLKKISHIFTKIPVLGNLTHMQFSHISSPPSHYFHFHSTSGETVFSIAQCLETSWTKVKVEFDILIYCNWIVHIPRQLFMEAIKHQSLVWEYFEKLPKYVFIEQKKDTILDIT